MTEDTSFGPISDDDIRTLMKHKMIPKNLGNTLLKQLRDSCNFSVNIKKIIDSGGTEEDVLELYKNRPVNEDRTASIKITKYLLNHKKQLEEFLRKLSNGVIRQTRDWIDSKLALPQKDDTSSADPLYQHPRIRLSQSEDRIVHSLSVLLSKKSETSSQHSPDYYMGNYEKGIATIKNDLFETARLLIKPHDLYRTYTGTDDYSGKQIDFIFNSLVELSKKSFLLALRSAPDANMQCKVVRTFLPLWQLVILNQNLSQIESKELLNNKLIEGRNCYLLLKFSPIFTNNIRNRYVEVPEDMHLRIAKAANSKRIPECTHVIRDLLLREKQQGQKYQNRCSFLRDVDTLVELCNFEKLWKEGKKKKVRSQLKSTFDIFIKVGLLLGVNETCGKKGQNQYEFEINPEFK